MAINKPEVFLDLVRQRCAASKLDNVPRRNGRSILVNYFTHIIVSSDPLAILVILAKIDYNDLSQTEANKLARVLIERVETLLYEDAYCMSQNIALILQEVQEISGIEFDGTTSVGSAYCDYLESRSEQLSSGYSRVGSLIGRRPVDGKSSRGITGFVKSYKK